MIISNVVGVMQMGNIVPRAVINPKSLAFRASVLTITPLRLSNVTTVSMPTSLCSFMPQRSVLTTTPVPLELYVHMSRQSHHIHEHRVVQQPYTVDSLYKTMVKTTSVVGVLKMGNVGPHL